MTEIEIVVAAAGGQRQADVFTAHWGDILLATFFDSARKLLEIGAEPTDLLIMRHQGEPEVVPAHNPQDGINAVRRMLDRTIIDPVRCAEGLDLLRNYKYEWQERKRIWSPHPRHDFASHCADALRCFAAGHDPNAPRVGSGRSYSQPVTTPSHWAS